MLSKKAKMIFKKNLIKELKNLKIIDRWEVSHYFVVRNQKYDISQNFGNHVIAYKIKNKKVVNFEDDLIPKYVNLIRGYFIVKQAYGIDTKTATLIKNFLSYNEAYKKISCLLRNSFKPEEKVEKEDDGWESYDPDEKIDRQCFDDGSYIERYTIDDENIKYFYYPVNSISGEMIGFLSDYSDYYIEEKRYKILHYLKGVIMK